MRHRFLSICLLCCVISMTAQHKVIERSAKQAPEWIYKTIPDYLIISAEGATLDQARQICMNNIKAEIANSIAINISAQTVSQSEQSQENGSYSIKEHFRSEITSVAAELPFITGISIANAEDSYWEKRYDTQQKRQYYLFFLKYPFSNLERNRLKAAFLAYDAQKEEELSAIKENSARLNNVDDIERYIAELKPLIDYFFDETRKTEASTLKKELEQIYKNIAVIPISNEPGHYCYALIYNGRKLYCSRQPLCRSEYASHISVIPQNDTTVVITYDYDGCIPEDENRIDLVFNLGGHINRHTFHFDPSSNQLAVKPQGKINITIYQNADGENVDSISANFSLQAKYATRFAIESATITTADFSQLEFSGNEKTRDLGQGRHVIRLTCHPAHLQKTGNQILAEGFMQIKNLKTQKVQVIDIRLPYEIIYSHAQ